MLKDFRDKLDTYMLQNDDSSKLARENDKYKASNKKMKGEIERKDRNLKIIRDKLDKTMLEINYQKTQTVNKEQVIS